MIKIFTVGNCLSSYRLLCIASFWPCTSLSCRYSVTWWSSMQPVPITTWLDLQSFGLSLPTRLLAIDVYRHWLLTGIKKLIQYPRGLLTRHCMLIRFNEYKRSTITKSLDSRSSKRKSKPSKLELFYPEIGRVRSYLQSSVVFDTVYNLRRNQAHLGGQAENKSNGNFVGSFVW